MSDRQFFAPGRVNLIGDHTDYGGGLALPIAIDAGVIVKGRASQRIELTSALYPERVDVDASGGTSDGWGALPAAVAAELNELGRPAVGFTGTVESSLTAGAGLSSSAALGVAFAIALCAVAEFEPPRLALAEAVQRAEQRARGVPCGLLDQAAAMLGRVGHALLLDFSGPTYRYVPLPPEIAIVVLDTGIRHELAASAYAQRRSELERSLTGATDPVAVKRSRHFRSENDRVRRVAAALESGELDTIGPLLRQSHNSLRDDYEVSIPQLDALVDAALASGALGARLTGGGFGGSVVALVQADEAASFVESLSAETACANAFATRPSCGAREL